MRDGFGRTISYLRLSVTDRCNFRCRYCLPPEGIRLEPHEEILRFEEMLRLVRLGADLGIRRVRVTGGEPLLRRGIAGFLEELGRLPGIEEVALTTNGSLLAREAPALKAAGVRELNVSLDTLRPERFRELTRGGDLAEVWRGIEKAVELGFAAVKLNVVLLKGFNDDELLDLARLSERYPLAVRFIELMPLGEADGHTGEFLPVARVREDILRELRLEPEPTLAGRGPAIYYRRPGSPGRVGFIAAMTEHFCAGCNRLRLTAQGELIPCLGQETGTDLRGPLRAEASDEELRRLWLETVALKPSGHTMGENGLLAHRMSRLGG